VKIAKAATLYRFSSYSPVTGFWLGSTSVLLKGIDSEGEDRCDGFGLVADRICERSNSAVRQLSAELLGRSGRVHVRNDLQLVPERHRSVVLDRHPYRPVQKFGITEQVVLDDTPIHGVVHVVEDVDVADAHRVIADLCGILAAGRLQILLPQQALPVGGA